MKRDRNANNFLIAARATIGVPLVQLSETGLGLLVAKGSEYEDEALEIKAELYFGVADEDASCTPEHQDILASTLGAAHVAYQIELYRGARHGFAVLDMPVYDEAAAKRHWERLATLFASAL